MALVGLGLTEWGIFLFHHFTIYKTFKRENRNISALDFCCSRPGSTTSAAHRQKQASTPRQCLMRTSSVSSRGCRPSEWTSSECNCPPTSRTTRRPRIQSPLVASPARTSWGLRVGKIKWKEVKGGLGRGEEAVLPGTGGNMGSSNRGQILGVN